MALTLSGSTDTGYGVAADTNGVRININGVTKATFDASGNFSLAAATGTKSSTITSTDTAAYYEAVGASGAGNVQARLQSNATTAQVGTLSNHQFNIQAYSTNVALFEKDKSIALQNASPQSGTGITFPATQSASSNANTLDDYEEGTWTPSISYETPGTLSVGYASRSGVYTKIGQKVSVYGVMRLNAFTKGTASGTLKIDGLPFALSAQETPVGSIGFYDAAFTGFPVLLGIPSSTYMLLLSASSNATWSSQSDPDANAQYVFSLTYFV